MLLLLGLLACADIAIKLPSLLEILVSILTSMLELFNPVSIIGSLSVEVSGVTLLSTTLNVLSSGSKAKSSSFIPPSGFSKLSSSVVIIFCISPSRLPEALL